MFFRKRKLRDELDTTLIDLGRYDALTVRDFLKGGTNVMGGSGSGKSSSSARAILEAIVRHGNSGGLIRTTKPEDKQTILEIFAAARRLGDLYIFEPGGDLRCNLLDCELRAGADARAITEFITTLGETVKNGQSRGGEDGGFWQQSEERMIEHAVVPLKLATGTVRAADLQQFLMGAAMSMEELSQERWIKGYHNSILVQADQQPKNEVEAHSFQMALGFWLREHPAMSDRTRSSILAGVMATLHVMLGGIVRDLICGETNIRPEITFERKFILVNAPVSVYGNSGKLLSAGMKHLMQRAVLRRKIRPADAINVIYCDEAHETLTNFDSQYLPQCRSHLGCMVYIAQGLSSYYSALQGRSGEHKVEALLGNFGTHIFHCLSDFKTAEWASKKIGDFKDIMNSGSMQPADTLFDEMMGHSRFSGGFSEHMAPVLPPHVFMNGMRCGGPLNRFLSDAYVIKSGEPFSSGQNWMRVTFSQR